MENEGRNANTLARHCSLQQLAAKLCGEACLADSALTAQRLAADGVIAGKSVFGFASYGKASFSAQHGGKPQSNPEHWYRERSGQSSNFGGGGGLL